MTSTWQEAPPDYDPAPLFASEDEKGLVGSMLFDPACIGDAIGTVAPTDFADLALRAAYKSITARYREADDDGQTLAAMVLADIKGDPAVDDARLLLTQIAEAVATAAHVKTFAEAVRDASIKRRIDDIATTAAKAARNGKAGTEVLADLLADAEELARSGDRSGGVEKLSMRELIKAHPTLNPPVVDGLFREGETANLIAASKVGKSWMIYGLAFAIANNERWLGRFDVSPGRVLIIDNELHPSVLSSRLRTVADAMGIEHSAIDRDIEFWPLRGNLRSLADLGAEFDKIDPGEFKAIILDAKYRFATEGESENDNAAETRVYNLIDQLASKTRAAFVLVHHASKGSQTDKAVTDVGAGAGAQSRATDCHMVIRPHEEDGCAVLEAAVRSFAPVTPVTLRWGFPLWIADEQLDPTKLAGRLGKGQQARSEEDQAGQAAILESFKPGEQLSNKQLRKKVGMGRDRLGRLLDVLESKGLVASETVIKGGRECDLFTAVAGVDGVDGPRTDHAGPGTGGLCVAAPKGGPSTPPSPGPGRSGAGGDSEEDPSTSLGPIPFHEFEESA